MHALSTEGLLDIWERGLHQTPLQRCLGLLVAAYPDLDMDSAQRLSIGQRDTLLMKLRASLFGSILVNTTRCPQCDERVEWESEIEDFLDVHPATESESGRFDLEVDGYQITFRLPTSLDLAAVLQTAESDDSTRQLQQRCIIDARDARGECEADRLPRKVWNALNRRLESLDPQADVRIGLSCPACAHRWDALFDIASFLWNELSAWAEKTLHTVHELASAYGWTEREILRLSPVRRELYLGLASR